MHRGGFLRSEILLFAALAAQALFITVQLASGAGHFEFGHWMARAFMLMFTILAAASVWLLLLRNPVGHLWGAIFYALQSLQLQLASGWHWYFTFTPTITVKLSSPYPGIKLNLVALALLILSLFAFRARINRDAGLE